MELFSRLWSEQGVTQLHIFSFQGSRLRRICKSEAWIWDVMDPKVKNKDRENM